MPGGRRRTDPPGGLWGGTPADGSGGHPSGSARDRGEPFRPSASSAAEAPHRMPHARLPLPPVPASAGGTRASAAPFRAVPAPELPGGPAGDGRLSAGTLDDAGWMSGRGVTPVLPRPARVWPDDEPELVSTGPGLAAAGARGSGPAPRLPRQTTLAGAPSQAYGDWTKPSRPSEPLDGASGQLGLRLPLAPATTAIPERPANRRMADDERFDRAEFDRAEFDRAEFDRAEFDSAEFDAPRSDEFPAPARTRGPGMGSGSGRAAMRAQRQAADMARRKAAKRMGEPVGVPDDEDGTAGRPRRVVLGLVAMAVVALGVLGVYTVVSPATEEAGSTASQTSAPGAARSTAVLPPLQTDELQVDVAPETAAAPAAPVYAPVTVLNATDVNGLAARVSETIKAGGWETSGVGTYLADDVTTTTVFYTEGDDIQRQAAESLKAQFPQLQTTAVRSFEVPAEVTAPGIVVVLAAEWS